MHSETITEIVRQTLEAWNAMQRKSTELHLGHTTPGYGDDRQPVTFSVGTNEQSSMRWFNARNTQATGEDPMYLGDALRRIAEQADITAREYTVMVELHGKINNVEFDAITLYVTEHNSAGYGTKPERHNYRISTAYNWQFGDVATDNARQMMWSLGRGLFATVYGTESSGEVMQSQAFQRRIAWNHHVVDLQRQAGEITRAAQRLERLLSSQLEASKVR